MKHQCKLCRERGKTWNGSDPICAFENGRNSVPTLAEVRSGMLRENWNCATLNRIRDLCTDPVYCDEQFYATLNVSEVDLEEPAIALWVSWYKNRGQTDKAILLDGWEPPRVATERDLLAIIAALEER